MKSFNVIIVGGGAAGFFAAINLAKMAPHLQIAIVERGKQGLQKVKISGGGRCNVTHAEFVPSELVPNYPRGEKELLGPFHHFMTGDTMQWFADRGIELKIEEDGRIFPVSDSSQTIIDCFLQEANQLKVEIFYSHSIKTIEAEGAGWKLATDKSVFRAEKVLFATGSNPKIWNLLKSLGHEIIDPVPSLFTFNCDDKRLKDIAGVVVPNVSVKPHFDQDLDIPQNYETNGPLLVTHWGLSAPAVLKLSAIAAIDFAKSEYRFQLEVNFVNQSFESVLAQLKEIKRTEARKRVSSYAQLNIPKRLWKKLVEAAGISYKVKWADLNLNDLQALAQQLSKAIFHIKGKSTYKDEFVTAGGIDLKEIDFKTFESRKLPGIYFAGEIMNVDAVTGGFNFQNAWTSAYLAAEGIANHYNQRR